MQIASSSIASQLCFEKDVYSSVSKVRETLLNERGQVNHDVLGSIPIQEVTQTDAIPQALP